VISFTVWGFGDVDFDAGLEEWGAVIMKMITEDEDERR